MRHSGRRGSRIARREEGACRVHVTDEQRSEAGCIGGQNDAVISGQALTSAVDVEMRHDQDEVVRRVIFVVPYPVVVL